ncbi:M16 family metallopeptidase [Sphingomonas sp. GlSt437]|uniref:M16 family metallopeptidase n=2 Tax=Pseudomonadota TaxID=1224 RepID=UPI003A8881D8
MRYAIQRHEAPKGEVSIRFSVRGGAKDESDAERGAAHFVEHMAFNGSKNIPNGQLLPMLERLGLSFGRDTNAETAFDHTTYKLDLPKAKPDTLDAGFLIMREIAGNLTIAPDAVERERGVIVSEASFRNDANRRRLENVLTAELPGNRLALAVRADPDQIRRISAQSLRAFYEAYYRPDQATLVIVGDVDPASIEKKIISVFSDWKPAGAAGSDYRGPVAQAAAPTIASFVDPAIPDIVQFERARAYTPPANTVEEERQKLLETIAGTAVANRLQPVALAKDSPIQGAQFSRQDLARNAQLFGLYLIARDGRWQDAVAIGEQELRRAYLYGFAKGEIDEIKANILSALSNAAAQKDGQRNGAIAEGLISNSLENAVPTSPDFDLAFYKSIESSITAEAVTAAFKSAWQGKPTLVHVSAKTPIENPAATIAALIAKSEQVAVAPTAQAATKAFAYDNFGQAGQVVYDKTIADLGIRTVRFANGLELNLKKTNWEPAKVAFEMDVGQGASTFPADQPGLFVMAGILLPQDGLQAHDATELRRILAGHQVSLGINAAPDALTAAGSVATSDLDLQLKLLAARLSATGFRAETAAQWGPFSQTVSKALSAQPTQIWQLALNYVLTGGDGRTGLPSPDALTKLGFDQMKAAVAPQLANGPVSLSLVGDFDEDAAIAAVAKTLGALPKREDRKHGATPVAPIAFKAHGTVTLSHSGQPDQGVVSISWPTTDDHDLKAALTRDLLAQVMNIEAIEIVRQKLGATYTPQGLSYDQPVFEGYGHLTLVATAKPQDMDPVEAAFRQIAADVRDKLIAADLLTRAREPILTNYARTDGQNEAWVGSVNYAQSWPERLDRRRQRADILKSITTEDLQAAARRYLVDNKSVAIRVVSASQDAK